MAVSEQDLEYAIGVLQTLGLQKEAERVRAAAEAKRREVRAAEVALTIFRKLTENLPQGVEVDTVRLKVDGIAVELDAQGAVHYRPWADRLPKEASQPKAKEDGWVACLRQATEEMGLKWYGARNASRTKRVVERAREIARSKGVPAPGE